MIRAIGSILLGIGHIYGTIVALPVTVAGLFYAGATEQQAQAQQLALRLRMLGLDPDEVVRDKDLIKATEDLIYLSRVSGISIQEAYTTYAHVALAKRCASPGKSSG